MNKQKLEELFLKFRWQFIFLLLGVVLLGGGLIFLMENFMTSPKVEVLDASTDGGRSEIVVEISGAVERPGVYKLSAGSRVDDLITIGSGVTEEADTAWMEKSINRAARLNDGQKVHIRRKGEIGGVETASQNVGGDLIDINGATLNELISLPDIAEKRAQSIIEHRPYSNLEELVSKGAITRSVFEKIKDLVTY